MAKGVMAWTTTGAAALALALAACSSGTGGSPTGVTPPPATGGTSGDGLAGAAAARALLGTWRLVSLQPAGGPVLPVPAGTPFTAEFGSDDVVRLVVDCNRCSGGYAAGADTLAIGSMACTRAYCVASAPFDSTYEKLLAASLRWRVESSSLELRGEAGSMTFVR
jgi:heat shock protein HslJ